MITTSQGHDASLLLIGAKLAGSLFFVLALFLVGVWLVRLLQRQKLISPRKPENEIEIRSTRSLGPRSQIVLVSVGGNSFLVGVAPSGISLLGKIDESSPRSAPPAITPSASSRPPAKAASSPGQEAGSDPTSFDAAVREALDRIGALSRERSSRERTSRWTV